MQIDCQNDFTRYPGGKGQSFRNILNLFPPHTTYVETHLGSGALLRRKAAANRNVGIEKDPDVFLRWGCRGGSAIELHCCDAIEWLYSNELERTALVYCDPPYLATTRRTARYYRYDYDEQEHVRLLECLLRLPCMVVVSGYRSSLYDLMLGNWFRTDYSATTHHGEVTESAWTNFKPGVVLHDYAWVGDDFRERERIRRKRKRIVNNLLGLPPIELNAILANLVAERPDLHDTTASLSLHIPSSLVDEDLAMEIL